MPLVILAFAAGIRLWGSRAAGQRKYEAQAWVTALLRDVAAQGERAPGLAGSNLQRQLGPLLVEVAGAEAGGALEVVVTPGDTTAAGPNPPQSATHVAMIRRGGADRLGLRLVSDGQNPVTIIGFWRAGLGAP